MGNMFASIIGENETNRVDNIAKYKAKAKKIVEDLKSLLPIESIEKSGYDCIHIGKIGKPYSCVHQTRLFYNDNSVNLCVEEISAWNGNKVLFEGFTFQDLINKYSKYPFSSETKSYPIKIDLSTDMGLKVAYWLIRKEILDIR